MIIQVSAEERVEISPEICEDFVRRLMTKEFEGYLTQNRVVNILLDIKQEHEISHSETTTEREKHT